MGVRGKMSALTYNSKERCSISEEADRIFDADNCKLLVFFALQAEDIFFLASCDHLCEGFIADF